MIDCSRIKNISVVRVENSLTAATVDAFREEMAEYQEREPDVRNFVVDLAEVEFMDSAGLGSLIAALKRVSERGGDMKIACLQKKPRMVFEITRAYKVFEIYNSVDEALRAFEL